MRVISFSVAPCPLRILGTAMLGVGLLTLSSYIEVPRIPVPMTMQTLAVTLIGAMFGARLGTAIVTVWLALAAAGLPLLASGACGLAPFAGSTAGYLFAFPLAAAITGRIVTRPCLFLAFFGMIVGNVLCLAGGAAWLTVLIGFKAAFAVGVAPFLAGGLVKAGLGAVLLKLIPR